MQSTQRIVVPPIEVTIGEILSRSLLIRTPPTLAESRQLSFAGISVRRAARRRLPR